MVGATNRSMAGDVRRMVTQEGAPSRGGRSASLDHILRDAGLSDLKAELEQLAMDCAAPPTADCQRSSAGSARAGPRRFAVGLQRSGISNASTGGSRLDAIARGSRGADSDEVARAFRDDVARCSDMMSP